MRVLKLNMHIDIAILYLRIPENYYSTSHLLTLLPIFPCIPVCLPLTSPANGFSRLRYLHDFNHLRHFLLIFLQYLLLANPYHQRVPVVKAERIQRR